MIRRGDNKEIAEPIFKYLRSVYEADIEEIDNYTPVSANKELKEEVLKIPGMSQDIYDQGVSEGITQGITQERADNVKQFAEYFMAQDPELTEEKAVEMAKGILK